MSTPIYDYLCETMPAPSGIDQEGTNHGNEGGSDGAGNGRVNNGQVDNGQVERNAAHTGAGE